MAITGHFQNIVRAGRTNSYFANIIGYFGYTGGFRCTNYKKGGRDPVEVCTESIINSMNKTAATDRFNLYHSYECCEVLKITGRADFTAINNFTG